MAVGDSANATMNLGVPCPAACELRTPSMSMTDLLPVDYGALDVVGPQQISSLQSLLNVKFSRLISLYF